MKRFGFLIIFIVIYASCMVGADPVSKDSEFNGFILPQGLEIIGDEAFEGTAAEVVVIGGNITTINARTFANAVSLTTVFISASTKLISEDAFEGTSEITIIGHKGSYAEDWAKRHRIPFVPDYSAALLSTNTHTVGQSIVKIHDHVVNIEEKVLSGITTGHYFTISWNTSPQERAELQVVDYWFP